MCDMSLAYGHDSGSSGLLDEPLRKSEPKDDDIPGPSKGDGSRSTYAPRFFPTNIPGPLYHPPQKVNPSFDRMHSYSYYPTGPYVSKFPQQPFQYPAHSNCSSSMTKIYEGPANNYMPQQSTNFQYYSPPLKPSTDPYQGFQGIDSRYGNNSFAPSMRPHPRGTCENCRLIATTTLPISGEYYSGSSNATTVSYHNEPPPHRFTEDRGNLQMQMLPSSRFQYPSRY